MIGTSNKDYQAHDDKHTLKRAAEIQADAKRHAAAKNAAKQDIKQLQGIAGVKPVTKRTVRKVK
jgi:hypothetical protein